VGIRQSSPPYIIFSLEIHLASRRDDVGDRAVDAVWELKDRERARRPCVPFFAERAFLDGDVRPLGQLDQVSELRSDDSVPAGPSSQDALIEDGPTVWRLAPRSGTSGGRGGGRPASTPRRAAGERTSIDRSGIVLGLQ
jgi:hypothetical protein